MNEAIQLVPGKFDYDLAKEHREAIVKAAQPFLEALTGANQQGFKFNIQFGISQFDQKVLITNLMLMKEF